MDDKSEKQSAKKDMNEKSDKQLSSKKEKKSRFGKREVGSSSRGFITPAVLTLAAAAISATATLAAAFFNAFGFQPNPVSSHNVPREENPEIVKKYEEPRYDDFEIIKHIRVVDLRSRIPVPLEKRSVEPISPVTWTRYVLLKKISKDVDYIDFEFGTTGWDIDARCLTHEYKIRKPEQPHLHGETELTAQIVRVDIRNEPVDKLFLIINEATYWNGFSGEDTEWASMTANQKETIALVLLFPEDKPLINYELTASKHGEVPKTFREPSVVIPSENKLVLLWRVEEPTPNYSYRVDWAW